MHLMIISIGILKSKTGNDILSRWPIVCLSTESPSLSKLRYGHMLEPEGKIFFVDELLPVKA